MIKGIFLITSDINDEKLNFLLSPVNTLFVVQSGKGQQNAGEDNI